MDFIPKQLFETGTVNPAPPPQPVSVTEDWTLIGNAYYTRASEIWDLAQPSFTTLATEQWGLTAPSFTTLATETW